VTDVDTPVMLPLPASDPDQDAETLTFSATSTSAALLPDANVAFVHSAAGWQMTLTPAAGATGSADVTVTATDDTGATGSTAFLFTVNGPSNSAPTDITLAPGTVPENSPPGTPVGQLGAIDPDPGQVAAFALVGEGPGLFVLADASSLVTAPGTEFDYETAGFHQVLVRATDPTGAAFEKILDVVVLNANEPPSVALAVPASVPPGTTAFVQGEATFSDPDAGAGDVTVTFEVLHGTLSLDGSGALSGKLTGNSSPNLAATAAMADLNLVLADSGLVYTSDPGYDGADSLEVTIDDNGHSGEGSNQTASTTAAFFVQPSPLETWRRDTFSPAELDDPDISDLTADGDGDGLTVLMEYKLAKNPKDPSDAWDDITLGPVEDGGAEYFELTFIQRSDASDPDTALHVDTATDLSGWLAGPGAVQVISREPLPGDLERVTVRSLTPLSDELREYFRMRVVTR
jgi:hypothetical protein